MEKKQVRFSVWYFVGAFFLLLLAHTYLVQEQSHEITYSQFKTLLASGKVSEASLGPDYVTAKLPSVQDLAGVLPEPQLEALQHANAKSVSVRAVRVEDPKLIEQLEAAKIPFSGRLASTWVTELASWVGSLVFFVVIWLLLFRCMGAAGGGLMAIGKSKAKVYVEKETRTTFEDVAGNEEAKEELREVVQFLKAPEKFRRLGGNIPKGVLLVGAPGTGKTLLARAVAGEAKVPFFSMSGSEFVEMFVGVGAARVRDLFEQAKQKAPCIVFVDELDALGKARGMNPFGGHDEREQTLNQLLVEMDGFDPSAGVIIMSATNRPEILDAALLRAGRFDRHVAIDRPDIKAREAILRVHAKNVRLAPDVDLALVAQRTPGFVGADLANIVNEAALLAARHDKDQVTMHEFEEAVDRVTVGLEKKTRVMSQREKRIVAYHETGHALVASLLPNNEPVRKISIIPRGIGALGYTQQLPTEDRYLMTRSELEDRLCILFGGRVAEEIVFGDVSTGAQDDLQKATSIALGMVTQYGMSEVLGLRAFDRERRSPFLDGAGPVATARDHSDETASAIDAEVARILEHAHERVRAMLTSRRALVEIVAQKLLDQEVIDGDELRAMISEAPEPVTRPAASAS